MTSAVPDGETLLSASQMALLFGVTEEQIRTSMATQGCASTGAWAPPANWVRTGRRRVRQAQAATGSTAMKDVLAHLARTTPTT